MMSSPIVLGEALVRVDVHRDIPEESNAAWDRPSDDDGSVDLVTSDENDSSTPEKAHGRSIVAEESQTFDFVDNTPEAGCGSGEEPTQLLEVDAKVVPAAASVPELPPAFTMPAAPRKMSIASSLHLHRLETEQKQNDFLDELDSIHSFSQDGIATARTTQALPPSRKRIPLTIKPICSEPLTSKLTSPSSQLPLILAQQNKKKKKSKVQANMKPLIMIAAAGEAPFEVSNEEARFPYVKTPMEGKECPPNMKTALSMSKTLQKNALLDFESGKSIATAENRRNAQAIRRKRERQQRQYLKDTKAQQVPSTQSSTISTPLSSANVSADEHEGKQDSSSLGARDPLDQSSSLPAVVSQSVPFIRSRRCRMDPPKPKEHDPNHRHEQLHPSQYTPPLAQTSLQPSPKKKCVELSVTPIEIVSDDEAIVEVHTCPFDMPRMTDTSSSLTTPAPIALNNQNGLLSTLDEMKEENVAGELSPRVTRKRARPTPQMASQAPAIDVAATEPPRIVAASGRTKKQRNTRATRDHAVVVDIAEPIKAAQGGAHRRNSDGVGISTHSLDTLIPVQVFASMSTPSTPYSSTSRMKADANVWQDIDLDSNGPVRLRSDFLIPGKVKAARKKVSTRTKTDANVWQDFDVDSSDAVHLRTDVIRPTKASANSKHRLRATVRVLPDIRELDFTIHEATQLFPDASDEFFLQRESMLDGDYRDASIMHNDEKGEVEDIDRQLQRLQMALAQKMKTKRKRMSEHINERLLSAQNELQVLAHSSIVSMQKVFAEGSPGQSEYMMTSILEIKEWFVTNVQHDREFHQLLAQKEVELQRIVSSVDMIVAELDGKHPDLKSVARLKYLSSYLTSVWTNLKTQICSISFNEQT